MPSTENELARRALRESERRFRHLADHAPVFMWVSDASKQCTWVNRPWLTFVGRPLEAEIGFGWMDNIHPLDRERCEAVFNAAFDERKPFTTEYRLRRHDGIYRWLLDSGSPTFDTQGAFSGFMGSSVDITARKEVEEELESRTRTLEVLNRVGRTLSAELELDTLLQSITDAAREVTGARFGAFFYNARNEAGGYYTLFTLSGAPREAFERFGLPRATPLFGPTFRGEGAVRSGDVRKDPRYGHMGPHHGMPEGHLPVRSYLAVPVTSRSGEVLGGLFFGHPEPDMFTEEHEHLVMGIASQAAVAVDNANLFRTAQRAIAEHERTGAALRSSEQRFRMMADNAPIMIWMTDERGENSYFSKTWYDFTGQTEHADLTDAWSSLLHPGERGRIVAEFHDAQRQRQAYRQEYRLRRHDGTFRWVVDVAAPRFTEEGIFEGFIGSIMDIDDRKRAELALGHSEERLRVAMDAAKLGVWEWDLHTERVTWTEAVYAMHGISHADFDHSAKSYSALVHPDDRQRLRATWQALLSGQGRPDIEFRIVMPDGGIRWLFTSARVLHDDGRPARLLGATLDITERKRTEELLREADRRKDEFLATLAHELRNPLAPLRSGLEVLDQGGSQDPVMVEVRRMMGRQMTQMVRLIDDLLDVSRISRDRLELRKEDIDIAVAIRNAVETSRPLLSAAGHQFVLSLPSVPVLVHADLTRLSQVFANLLNNAAKYTPGPGRIELTLGIVDGHAQVTVADNGIGIPPEMQPRIFEMFTQVERTLEKTYGGLGIGLTLVQRLLALHDGSVTVHSAGEGHGSSFEVRLPLAAAASKPRPPGLLAHETRTPPSRVLLVDDNRDAVFLLSRLLRERGHDVRTAHDGIEAVEAAETFRPEVALLDIGMPRLNGYDTARELRARPWGRDMTLIALTGWGQEEDRRRSREAGFDHHLLKPVEPRVLFDMLARLKEA